MGYDGLPAPGQNESAEITIEVNGAVDQAAFNEFKKKLRDCLNELAKLQGGKGVTWSRVGIRRYGR
jgi:hypothetical protein